jgi:hypothetical protein
MRLKPFNDRQSSVPDTDDENPKKLKKLQRIKFLIHGYITIILNASDVV